MTSLQKRIRAQEDQLDESKQLGIKGNLLITNIQNKEGRKECFIKLDKELKTEVDSQSMSQNWFSLMLNTNE